jgi:hypothetical protein
MEEQALAGTGRRRDGPGRAGRYKAGPGRAVDVCYRVGHDRGRAGLGWVASVRC